MLRPKVDSDGLERFFPQKMEIAIYWADWDQNGTPEDLRDDFLTPILLWRINEVTGGPLPVQAGTPRPSFLVASVATRRGPSRSPPPSAVCHPSSPVGHHAAPRPPVCRAPWAPAEPPLLDIGPHLR